MNGINLMLLQIINYSLISLKLFLKKNLPLMSNYRSYKILEISHFLKAFI